MKKQTTPTDITKSRVDKTFEKMGYKKILKYHHYRKHEVEYIEYEKKDNDHNNHLIVIQIALWNLSVMVMHENEKGRTYAYPIDKKLRQTINRKMNELERNKHLTNWGETKETTPTVLI